MLSLISSKLLLKMRPFTIAVEGNIGCGKTTFLNHFQKSNKDILIAAEPVSQWQSMRGHNLLQLMYEDTEKWAFTFQTYVQLTMMQMHTLQSNHPVKMMERSLHSARYCFVENLWKNGKIVNEQKAVLDEWYQWLSREGMLNVDLIVYLRASPSTVFRRLQQRGRIEEEGVPLSLLENLHELHDDWLIRGAYPKIAPVLILNADATLENMSTEYDRCDFQMKKMIVAQR